MDNTLATAENVTYMAASDTHRVVVTLPASPVVGNIVRVIGSGQGGWSIVPNHGQTIAPDNLVELTWTPMESNRAWYSIASSSDGRKLAAVVWGGQIYTGTNPILAGVSGGPGNSLELQCVSTTPVVSFRATFVSGPLTVKTQ